MHMVTGYLIFYIALEWRGVTYEIMFVAHIQKIYIYAPMSIGDMVCDKKRLN